MKALRDFFVGMLTVVALVISALLIAVMVTGGTWG